MTAWLKPGLCDKETCTTFTGACVFLNTLENANSLSNSLKPDRNLLTLLTFAALLTCHSSRQMHQRTKSSCLEEGIKVTV